MSNSVKIMPLGDSITEGFRSEETGGYRGPLSRMFANAGFPVEFVGNHPEDVVSNWAGHGGFRSDEIAQNVHDWLDPNPPDFVLLHIGTNDILQNRQDFAIANIEQILNNIDSFDTHIVVILAQIINHADPRSVPFGVETTTLNKSVATMAAARIARGDRLKVVNFESALLPADLSDGVHPNANGYAKMATVWFDALAPVLHDRFIPEEGYTLDILTGLAVNQKGILMMTSVVDLESWKPPVTIGDAIFTPGAPVAMAK